MRYEHTPRPNIESHYHIQELIEGQEKRADDRAYHRDREKAKQERNDLIKDSKWLEVKPFWCVHCSKDFIAQEIKQVEIDWTNPTQYVAFYKTKHKECDTWTIRLITDRHKDSYWFRSRKVRTDQGRHFRDTLQPFQTGYNLLYKKI